MQNKRDYQEALSRLWILIKIRLDDAVHTLAKKYAED